MAPASPQCPALQQRSFAEKTGGGRLVVKFTFLDIVDAGEPQPSISRACTDSALCKPAGDRWADYMPGSSTPHSEHSEGSDTDNSQQAPNTPSSTVPYCGRDQAASGRTQAKERVDKRTTLMLRNMPNNYTRPMLLEMLDDEGFARSYDFVYLPIDFSHGCGLGYAFVNLVSAELVPKFRATFEGYTDWVLPTAKVCQVTWSDPHQGLKANVKRYRNSPIMHPSVPDEYKPCLLVDGKRVPFPAPSRPLCRPHKRA